MADKIDDINKEKGDNEIENNEKNGKENKSTSNKNIKKIRKHLMSFAKDEILNIKQSKKEISVANFEEKEFLAPSKYSLTTKTLKIDSNKNYKSDIETVEENVKKENNDKNIIDTKTDNKKNEVSSSDISDED